MYHCAVTDDDLAQARLDQAFRKRLLANNLDHLLTALARLHASEHATDPVPARQLREGVQLAVKLADLLQKDGSAHVS